MPARLVPLALLAALLSAGCGPRAHPGRSNPPPLPAAAPTEVREVSLERGFLTIRVELPVEAPRPLPVVVSPLETRVALLEAGAAVVTYKVHWELLRGLRAPGPPPPPSTVGKWMLASPTPAVIGKGYFAIQAHAAEQAIPKVLDHLATLPEIDMTRIGLGGLSTTGFAALMAIPREPRIAAAAVVVSCGDFHDFLAGSPLAMNGAPFELAPDYDRWLTEREPIAHPDRFTHAALLMVNGTADVTVPYSCAETTAEVLAAAYARAGVPERFRFVPVEGGSHVLGERAMQEVTAWWWRWLLGPAVADGAHTRSWRAKRPV